MYVIITDAKSNTIGPFPSEDEALRYKKERKVFGIVRELIAP